MAMGWARSVGMIAVAGWIAGGAALPAYAQAPVEPPPVLRAADLVPADLLQGPHHRVEPQVPTDGLLAWFTITSSFGTFRVANPDMVRVRVGEVRALAELDKTTKSEVFAQALGAAAKRTGRSLQAVVENPAETVKALPEGVGRFFDRVGQATRTGVQQGREQRQEGSGELAGETAALAAGEIFGYYDAWRRLAKRVGVDPYTTNPVLAKKLDEIAWAVFAGEFGIDRAVGIVPGLNAAAWFSDLVWETPPGDLRVMIEKKLLELGAPPDAVDRFLRHRWYTLTLRTALVGGLDALSNARDARRWWSGRTRRRPRSRRGSWSRPSRCSPDCTARPPRLPPCAWPGRCSPPAATRPFLCRPRWTTWPGPSGYKPSRIAPTSRPQSEACG
jgi:hypothetical protein